LCNGQSRTIEEDKKLFKEDLTWIDVKYRLPPEGKEVLVLNKREYIQVGFIDEGVFKCREYMEITDATHWMGLPLTVKQEAWSKRRK